MTTSAPPKANKPERHSALNEETMLLHVNLPARIVKSVRGLAAEERRTITAQVTLLLEHSPKLQQYQQALSDHSDLEYTDSDPGDE